MEKSIGSTPPRRKSSYLASISLSLGAGLAVFGALTIGSAATSEHDAVRAALATGDNTAAERVINEDQYLSQRALGQAALGGGAFLAGASFVMVGNKKREE